MFRWTAGTKARADRAARLHNICVGPGRLLLASRPPPPPRPQTASPTPPKAAEAAEEERAEPTRASSPSSVRERSAPPNAETSSAAANEEITTPRPVEEAEGGVVASHRITSVLDDARATGTETAGTDLDGKGRSTSRDDVSKRQRSASLEAQQQQLRRPPAAPATVASTRVEEHIIPDTAAPPLRPAASSSSFPYAERLVQAALAPDHRGTKRHRSHHHHRHHRCRRSHHGVPPSSSNNSRYAHPKGGKLEEGRGDARRDTQGSIDSGVSLQSFASYATVNTDTQQQQQQRRLEETCYTAEERALTEIGKSRAGHLHSNNNISSSGGRSARGHRGALPFLSSPVPPRLLPAVSVDCLSVQQPLRAPPPPLSHSTTPSSSTAPSRVVNRREGSQSGGTPQSSAFAATAARGLSAHDGRRAAAALHASQQWSRSAEDPNGTDATSRVSDASSMVTVAADRCYRDMVAAEGNVDAALFQEPEAQQGISDASAMPYAMLSGEQGRLSWGADELQSARAQPQPFSPLDFEDRPLQWAPPQPMPLFEEPSVYGKKNGGGRH